MSAVDIAVNALKRQKKRRVKRRARRWDRAMAKGEKQAAKKEAKGQRLKARKEERRLDKLGMQDAPITTTAAPDMSTSRNSYSPSVSVYTAQQGGVADVEMSDYSRNLLSGL